MHEKQAVSTFARPWMFNPVLLKLSPEARFCTDQAGPVSVEVDWSRKLLLKTLKEEVHLVRDRVFQQYFHCDGVERRPSLETSLTSSLAEKVPSTRSFVM